MADDYSNIEKEIKENIVIYKYEDFIRRYITDIERYLELIKAIPLPEGEIFKTFRNKMIMAAEKIQRERGSE